MTSFSPAAGIQRRWNYWKSNPKPKNEFQQEILCTGTGLVWTRGSDSSTHNPPMSAWRLIAINSSLSRCKKVTVLLTFVDLGRKPKPQRSSMNRLAENLNRQFHPI